VWSSPSLRFLGRRYTRRGAGRGGLGRPHHQAARPRAGPRHGVVWALGGSPCPLLLATFVFWPNRNFWVFSENCWSSENMVSWQSFFQQNPDSDSEFSNNHQTCKIEEIT
jgi:hypothetical protein